MNLSVTLLIVGLIAGLIAWPAGKGLADPGDSASGREDSNLIQQLIDESARLDSIGQRIERVSERLVGRPYVTRPLIGSPTTPEQLVTRTDGFDCVTFVETVLAIVRSRTTGEFTAQLIATRYRDARVDWRSRHHYSTQWSAQQVSRGLLTTVVAPGTDTVASRKILHHVKGLEPVQATYHYYPKRLFHLIAPALQTGDIIFFVSGAEGLDTNHTGFIIRDQGRLLLRSASRSRRSVTDLPLTHYVSHQGMAGFFVNRPR